MAMQAMGRWPLHAAGAALLWAALALTAGCHPATAAESSCTPPAAWPAPGDKPGQPQQELSACLQQQAYEIRDLAIPLTAAAAGVAAQCEIRVDRFEGGAPIRDSATETAITQQAAAAVTRYRKCVGR